METLKSLREKARYSQDEVAKALGTHQPTISAMENGEKAITNPDLILKLAGMYGVPQERVQLASDHTVKVRELVNEASVALKVASHDQLIKSAAYLYRITGDWRLPDPIRTAAAKAIEDNGAAIKDASQSLGSGPYEHHRDGVAGSTVDDPDTDATGFRVARDGDGNWYLVDPTTDPPTISPVQYGDLVQQQGQPAGTKARDGDYRDGFGHKRKV